MRRRHSPAAGLAVAAIALAIVVGGPAGAQTNPADDFGGFQLSARANGFQFTYDSPGLLPVSPIIQLSMPEALATLSNGPTGYAIGAVAFPGPLVADLGNALAQGGTDAPIPSYPVRSEAFYPSGPTETSQELAPGATSHAVTSEGYSFATSKYTGGDLPAFFHAGSITGAAQTNIENGQVVSRARSEVTDLDLFYGLVHIQSVVTDLVGASDGALAGSAGATEVSGVTILGQPATINSSGIHLDQPPTGTPTSQPAGPLDPILGQIPGNPLAPVTEPLGTGLDALNSLAAQVTGQGGDQINALFESGGIKIRTLDPVEVVTGGSVTRNAGGVIIEVNYDGATAPVFSDILAAVPSDQLPSDPLIPGAPSSPQALFNLLKETHITTYSIAPAGLTAVASPAFEPPDFPLAAAGGPTGGSTGVSGGSTGTGGGFSAGSPTLGGSTGGSTGATTADGTPIGFFGIGIPAWLALGVLFVGAPLFGAGTRRLADNVLSEAVAGCPDEKQS